MKGKVARDETTRLRDTEFLALRAAYLLTQYGLVQDQLATVLGISQPHVSRLLRLAEQRGWLRRLIILDESGVQQRQLQAVQDSFCDRELIDMLSDAAPDARVKVRDIRVFPAGTVAKDRLKRLTRAAAGRIAELLVAAEMVGITWGGTLAQVIEQLEARPIRFGQEASITVIPLAGELIGVGDTRSSSSNLARRLHRLLNGGYGGEGPSLSGVLAFSPPSTRKSRSNSGDEIHRTIFGSQDTPGMVDRLDCVLTSIGIDDDPLGPRASELRQATNVTSADLRRLALSDFAGTLLPRPTLRRAEVSKIDRLNKAWRGVTLDQLRRVAQNAHMCPHKPGIVVVAAGVRKAAVFFQAVCWGLVNQAIVDDSLAGELRRLCRT